MGGSKGDFIKTSQTAGSRLRELTREDNAQRLAMAEAGTIPRVQGADYKCHWSFTKARDTDKPWP